MKILLLKGTIVGSKTHWHVKMFVLCRFTEEDAPDCEKPSKSVYCTIHV